MEKSLQPLTIMLMDNGVTKKTVLAIVGMAGAGKSEASEYLVQKLGWPKIHFGNIVTDETARRGFAVTQENERPIREEYRAKYGMGALAILSLPKIKEFLENSPGVFIESLYSWEEYQTLKKEFGDNFKTLAVFASFDVRAARLANREFRPLTREGLEERDRLEIETLHKAGPIAVADWTIWNESDLENLHKQIDPIIQKFI